jgi:hypothetical protein
MKKYAAIKGHGIRIGEGGRVDKTTQEITKRTYLYHHAEKAKSKLSKRQTSSCQVECPWRVNIWAKKSKVILRSQLYMINMSAMSFIHQQLNLFLHYKNYQMRLWKKFTF